MHDQVDWHANSIVSQLIRLLFRRSPSHRVVSNGRVSRADRGPRMGRRDRHAAPCSQTGDAVHAVRAAAQRAARPAARAAAEVPRLRVHEADAAAVRAAGGVREYSVLWMSDGFFRNDGASALVTVKKH